MDATTFMHLDDKLMHRANDVLYQRAKAYATDTDSLANFKEIAARAGADRFFVWQVLFQKGLSAVEKLMLGKEIPGESDLDRFADAINYLRLGWALYEEPKLSEARK